MSPLAPATTTTAPPGHPADLEFTDASSNIGGAVHRKLVAISMHGWLTAACLAGSWLPALKAPSTSSEPLALLLGTSPVYSAPGTGATSTGVSAISDLRPVLAGTSLLTVNYDNLLDSPFRATDTRMAELQALAPLSLRQWAHVFGVSKQAISNWIAEEPRERPELDAAVTALRGAAARQPDLAGWLQRHLPGSERTPLDLAKTAHWRAFKAASRLAAPVGAGVIPTQAMRDVARERRALAKRLGGADSPPAPEED